MAAIHISIALQASLFRYGKKQNDPSRNWSPTLPFCPIKIEGKKEMKFRNFKKSIANIKSQ